MELLHPKEQIEVENTLQSPHSFIRDAKRRFINPFPDSYGRLKPGREGGLAICVSKESIPRALCIMDALIKAIERRGWEFKDTTNEVVVDGEPVNIRLFEVVTRIESGKEPSSGLRQYHYTPTGQLQLIIDECLVTDRKKWSDGVKRRLEKELPSFIQGLVPAARQLKAIREERERWQNEYKEKARRREVIENRIKQMDADAEGWQKCCQIRNYLNALEARLAELDEHSQRDEWQEWIAWGRRYADAIDPLQKIRQPAEPSSVEWKWLFEAVPPR